MPFIVETNQLDYFFGVQKVLDRISIKVPRGSIYGFLGPNGAGKTTTLRLLLGLLKENGKSIRLFEKPFWSARTEVLQKTGSLIEQPSLYGHLTGRENLEVFRLSYPVSKERAETVLSLVGLQDAANKQTKNYSLGMKQRLAIAIALLPDPELLILDEPTNGLDPEGIIETRMLIQRLNSEQGKTILVSSHLLSEIEKIATHVGIIHQGCLRFQGTMKALQQQASGEMVMELETDDYDKAAALLEKQFKIFQAVDHIKVFLKTKKQVADVNALLVKEEISVYSLCRVQDDLENLFLQIISNHESIS